MKDLEAKTYAKIPVDTARCAFTRTDSWDDDTKHVGFLVDSRALSTPIHVDNVRLANCITDALNEAMESAFKLGEISIKEKFNRILK